jgi:hypothetical protein
MKPTRTTNLPQRPHQPRRAEQATVDTARPRSSETLDVLCGPERAVEMRAAAVRALQRHVGNAGVARLVQRAGATAERELQALQKPEATADTRVYFAGTPLRQNPPDGLSAIAAHAAGGLGSTGGWTGVKNAPAFTPPELRTTNSFVRQGTTVQHFAEVLPTAAQDATHDSYYPGPGLHRYTLGGNATQQIGGVTYTHYAQIDAQMSDLIRRGEEEHLSDALQAYRMTYGLAAARINGLVGRRFGPASNPARADALAADELRRQLPPALGIDPAGWVRMLNQLLHLTHLRDTRGWHDISNGPSRRSGRRIIWPLMTTSTTRIGVVPSNQIVQYPSP